jgi:hypothetical protein
MKTANILNVSFRFLSSLMTKTLILEFWTSEISIIIMLSALSTFIQYYAKWSWRRRLKAKFSNNSSCRSLSRRFCFCFVFHMQSHRTIAWSIRMTILWSDLEMSIIWRLNCVEMSLINWVRCKHWWINSTLMINSLFIKRIVAIRSLISSSFNTKFTNHSQE